MQFQKTVFLFEYHLKYNVMPLIQSCIFSIIITSVFSITWFFRNQSNMLICCSFIIIIIIIVENSCAESYFCGKFNFFYDSLMGKKFKRTAFI